MPLRHLLIAAVFGVAVAACAAAMRAPAALHPAGIAAHQAQCAGKDGWSDPAPPVRIFGNVYDVGTCGIAAVLVVGDKGAILIDGATAAAAPLDRSEYRTAGLAPVRREDAALLP